MTLTKELARRLLPRLFSHEDRMMELDFRSSGLSEQAWLDAPLSPPLWRMNMIILRAVKTAHGV